MLYIASEKVERPSCLLNAYRNCLHLNSGTSSTSLVAQITDTCKPAGEVDGSDLVATGKPSNYSITALKFPGSKARRRLNW